MLEVMTAYFQDLKHEMQLVEYWSSKSVVDVTVADDTSLL